MSFHKRREIDVLDSHRLCPLAAIFPEKLVGDHRIARVPS
jgi:hypothetical protein